MVCRVDGNVRVASLRIKDVADPAAGAVAYVILGVAILAPIVTLPFAPPSENVTGAATASALS
jgi:hypothetical protein